MIWAVLIVIGIPLRRTAVVLILLVRTRTKVRHIPGSVQCRARSMTEGIPDLGVASPRSLSTAHWVHDVLILHTGTFLIRTLPIGVAALTARPSPPGPQTRTTPFAEPVTLRVRADAGAEIELVCAGAEADRLLGPFRP